MSGSRPLRVALVVGAARGGGIYRYGMELAGALLQRTDVQLTVVGDRTTLAAVEGAAPAGREVGRIVLPASNSMAEAAYVRYVLGRVIDRSGVDVLHCIKHVLPRRCATPAVLTVHDLTLLEDSGQYPRAKALLLPRLYRRSLLSANLLVTDSRAMEAAVVGRFPQVCNRTVAVSLAVPSAQLHSQPMRPVKAPEGAFALAVGHVSPRKNFGFLARIWPDVHAACGLQLVVAGAQGWRAEADIEALRRLQRSGSGVWLGSVGDSELSWLYKNASVVCVPSLREGFGLPVAEALCHGTPVVCSDDPALVEAGGGRAIAVELQDASAWVSAICTTSQSPRLETAATRRSWDDVAAETLAEYRRVSRRWRT